MGTLSICREKLNMIIQRTLNRVRNNIQFKKTYGYVKDYI